MKSTAGSERSTRTRWLANVFAVTLAVLCLIFTGLWARCYVGKGAHWAWFSAGRRYHFETTQGTLNVGFRPNPGDKAVIAYWGTTFPINVIHGTMGGRRFFQMILPLWLPTFLFSLYPLIRAVRWYRRPAPAGLCPRCGYDLRATPDRCPECGSSPKTRVVTEVAK